MARKQREETYGGFNIVKAKFLKKGDMILRDASLQVLKKVMHRKDDQDVIAWYGRANRYSVYFEEDAQVPIFHTQEIPAQAYRDMEC